MLNLKQFWQFRLVHFTDKKLYSSNSLVRSNDVSQTKFCQSISSKFGNFILVQNNGYGNPDSQFGAKMATCRGNGPRGCGFASHTYCCNKNLTPNLHT